MLPKLFSTLLLFNYSYFTNFITIQCHKKIINFFLSHIIKKYIPLMCMTGMTSKFCDLTSLFIIWSQNRAVRRQNRAIWRQKPTTWRQNNANWRHCLLFDDKNWRQTSKILQFDVKTGGITSKFCILTSPFKIWCQN